MRRFTIEVIIFTLISMLCFSAFGQNWQDEEHVWDEEKQEWVVKNKAGGRVTNTPPEKGSQDNVRTRPFEGEPWERYLPRNVKYGKREPTQRELSEAQRKLWVKQVRTQRAMQEAEQRRQLMAHRRATGWYDARRNAGLQQGAGAYNMHMQTLHNVRYNQYQHHDGCAPRRGAQYAIPRMPTYNYPNRPSYQVRTYTNMTYTNSYAGDNTVRNNAYPNSNR